MHVSYVKQTYNGQNPKQSLATARSDTDTNHVPKAVVKTSESNYDCFSACVGTGIMCTLASRLDVTISFDPYAFHVMCDALLEHIIGT